MKISIYFGLAIGCLTGIWKLVEHYQKLAETEFAAYTGYVPLALLLTGITICVLIVRWSHGDAVLSYKDCIKLGLVVSLFASLVLGVFVFVYHQWLHPAYISDLLDTTEQTMIEEGATKEKIASELKLIEKNSGAWMQVFVATSATMMMGLMYSFISSVVLKKSS